MKHTKESGNTTGIIIGVIVVVVIALVLVFSGKKNPEAVLPGDQTTSQTPPADTTSQIPPADTTKPSSSVYKDGTYSATGSYMSPGGPDKIGVKVTLKNDIITDVSVTPMPGDPKSANFQGIFAANYKQYVVGKNIADVHLTKVSGSSLTGGGFNDALAQIKIQAKA